jgi:methyltransferase
MTFGWAHALILLVAIQRVAELLYARHNTRALMARGGVEVGVGHYPLFVLLHGSWLVVLFVATAPNPPVHLPLLLLFLLLQAGRAWVIVSLGPYWTTRIVVVPGAAPVRSGPYRFLRHPNYLIVAVEIPLLPLLLGMPGLAMLFGGLNLALLAYRIHVENAARRRLA